MTEQRYCPFCGTKLQDKMNLEEKREVPFCATCGEFRFPFFNSAVVMAIVNETKDQMLLVRQFGDERYYLVAGYVDQGETAERAVSREIREETGLTVTGMRYHRSHYYEPSNTLMMFYTAAVADGPVQTNEEVDDYRWFPIREACLEIPKHALAEELLKDYDI